MATIERSLSLKLVRFRAGRKRGFKPPSLQSLLLDIRKNAKFVADRHLPHPAKADDGDMCVFVDRIKTRSSGDGVIFTVGSYVKALTPDQVLPNFNQPEADIRTEPVIGRDGTPREVIHVYRCVAFGQALIVEFVKGGGGNSHLSHVLSQLFRAHSNSDLPNIELLDVSSNELENIISHGGGIDSMTAKMTKTAKPTKFFGQRLAELKRKVRNTGVISVTWESTDGALAAKPALDALQESSEESALDSVVLRLKDGQTIDRLGRYKEKRRVEIDLVRGGKISVLQVEQALWNYLDELRIPDRKTKWRLLDDDGFFIAPIVITGNT